MASAGLREAASPKPRAIYPTKEVEESKIEHENVVRFHETGYGRGRLRLARELLDGRTSRKHSIEQGRFPLEEALRVACELACGVAQV